MRCGGAFNYSLIVVVNTQDIFVESVGGGGTSRVPPPV